MWNKERVEAYWPGAENMEPHADMGADEDGMVEDMRPHSFAVWKERRWREGAVN
jgi:hypothetical protein